MNESLAIDITSSAAITTEPAYKMRVKSGAEWRQHKSRIRLEISVGAEYHNGPKFAAVVDSINWNHMVWLKKYDEAGYTAIHDSLDPDTLLRLRQFHAQKPVATDPKIEEVEIHINCTLQRHNRIAEGADEITATLDTYDDGTTWHKQHQPLIDQIMVPTTVHRWPHWLGQQDFEEQARQIKALARRDGSYSDRARTDILAALNHHDGEFIEKLWLIKKLIKADPDVFGAAIKADIDVLVARRAKHGKKPNNEAIFRDCSQAYIEEELAAFARMQPALVIYPGSTLLSVKYFAERPPIEGLELLSAAHRMRIDFASDRKTELSPDRQALPVVTPELARDVA